MKQLHLFCISIILLCFSCKKEQPTNTKIPPILGAIADSAMVVSAREEASKIGSDIMKQGGNAFDAMFATEMALAVSFPFAGNLGGGGFMVYRLNDGTTGALDYREKAPMAASPEMYLDDEGQPIANLSTQGALAVGVPGTVAGIFAAHKRFGKLPVEKLLQPVIELAQNGFIITEKQARRFAAYDSIITVTSGKQTPVNKSVKAGSRYTNQALAETLAKIAKSGRDEFYQGSTAKVLVDYLQQRGGIITMDDMAAYEAKWRKPVEFDYGDYHIISMSPPSSGGICLGQIMKMVEPFDIAEYGHNSLKTMQVMVEAERRAYADRSFYLGDPDFVDIPDTTLLSDAYLSERMANFSFEGATPSEEISYGMIPGYESNETTHYSIVDSYGNAISVTTTLNGAYGSKLYIEELGIFLNNEMDDFSMKPGEPNMFGLIGGQANAIEPEKRMLSSMTPTIVEKNNKFYMTLGTPGGSTIITSVLQTILNVTDFHMGMQEAVNAPRFHHQWLPDNIRLEPERFDPKLIDSLQERGYSINEAYSSIIGIVDGIKKMENGQLEGGADPRGDDAAIGF